MQRGRHRKWLTQENYLLKEIIVFTRELDRKSEGEGEGIESDCNACVNLLYYDFEISSSIY